MVARGDIRDWDKALATRCNWSWLSSAWGGTKISPSDIDFAVERNGHFLFIEQKPARDAMMRGQEIMLERLDALSPKVTVVYLVAEVDEKHGIYPSEMRVGGGRWETINRAGLFEFCKRWFAEADQGHSRTAIA